MAFSLKSCSPVITQSVLTNLAQITTSALQQIVNFTSEQSSQYTQNTTSTETQDLRVASQHTRSMATATLQPPLEKFIRNIWLPLPNHPGVEKTDILSAEIHPEGLDLARIRTSDTPSSTIPLNNQQGHILTVISGQAEIYTKSTGLMTLEAGTHTYVPAEHQAEFSIGKDSQIALVTTGHPSQAKGKDVLVRNEKYLKAACSGPETSRWKLTEQYLSRRLYLYHDSPVLSKNGDPVAWFHTTMFDSSGLPQNQDGLPVFKMSYNYRTEPNMVYDAPNAFVRMALHPYVNQQWGPWTPVDGDTTYHVNETATEADQSLEGPKRNKHEVDIKQGTNVSLLCIFDPAPTGAEEHTPGQYSSYGPLNKVLNTESYRSMRENLLPYDNMVDSLSMLDAQGASVDALEKDPNWEVYKQGENNQHVYELKLMHNLNSQGKKERMEIVNEWAATAGLLKP